MRKMMPAVLITIATLAFSWWAWPQLPERVVTHWGVNGQPNGWSSPTFAAFLMPGVMALMTLLFAALPNIDPLKKNYEFHGSVYFLLVNVVIGFVGIVQVMVLGSALGWPFDMRAALPLLLGALFVFMGNLLPRIRPNWFMGIRTPWTLSSERVWRKTHRIGGYAFTIAGLVFIATAFIPMGTKGTAVMLGIIFPTVLWPVVYSYLEWRREKEDAGTGRNPTAQ
jgi:uncharacterized membrane protein